MVIYNYIGEGYPADSSIKSEVGTVCTLQWRVPAYLCWSLLALYQALSLALHVSSILLESHVT